jgi:hypothetical protein
MGMQARLPLFAWVTRGVTKIMRPGARPQLTLSEPPGNLSSDSGAGQRRGAAKLERDCKGLWRSW